MRFSSVAVALGLAGLAMADDTPSDVLSLTSDTFASTVDSAALILVEYFAPWCGHCKALAPQYEEAATTLKAKNIPIAKIDCVDNSELCQEHGIQGYPTLKVYRNGKPTDYSGPRQADGIISYMVKQSLPAVSEVTQANHADFVKADKIVVVAYVATSTDEPAPEFSAVAEKHRDDYLFGLSTDADAAALAAVTPPAIVVYRAFDEHRTEYPYPVKSAKVSDIADFVKDLSIPVIDEVSGENYGTYAASEKPLAYLFLDPTEENKEAHIAAIKPIAREFKDKINCVWIDALKFADHAKALNLNEVKWPSFVIQDMVAQLKYPFSQEKDVTAKEIGSFLKDFTSGKLEPSLKSQPIPETQGNVFVLVGKQFDQVALDSKKDVLVEFYAPWCGHCKRLAPTWDQLGDRYAENNESLVIAKMDATENDVPPSVPFRIAGFPTIKFRAAGSEEWLDYDGDRSIESLIEFVESNAKNALNVKPYVKETSEVPPAPVEEVSYEGHADEHDHDHDEL